MSCMNPFHRLLRTPLASRPRPAVTGPVVPDPQVAEMLATSRVAWLSTVDEDGAPALVPTWFWWDGEVFWLFAKPGQRKLRNIRRFERVTLAVGDPHADFDVQLVEGSAHAVDVATSAIMPAAMQRAYDTWLTAAGLDWDRYCAIYRQPIVVQPTRFVPWRGLSHRPTASRPADRAATRAQRPVRQPVPSPAARPMALRPSATLA